MEVKSVLDATKLAADNAKPLIEVLTAQWLNRVRKRSAAKDLEGRVNAVLRAEEEFFGFYLGDLYRRVSSIKTIAFPLEELPLIDLYEPATLINPRTDKTCADKELKEQGRHTYIIDSAGMGKSTFAKHLILQEIEKGDLIPLFLELRKVKPGEQILSVLASDLDAYDTQFERDVFEQLLATEPFLIVLDGFDEVAMEERGAIGAQIEQLAVKSANSVVVLTSRPLVALPSMPNGTAMALQNLTEEQAQSVVLRLDAHAKVKVGPALIKNFGEVPSEMLETPLLVALLYKTFSYTGAVSNRITTFYDELYNALFNGHDLTKSGFSRVKQCGLNSEDFRRLLCGFAFILVSKEVSSIPSSTVAVDIIKSAEALTSIHPKSPLDWLEDMLTSIPLLLKDGTEIRFLHKTLTEYFAAEYIAFGNHGSTALTNICNSGIMGRFKGALSFLSEIHPHRFLEEVAVPAANNVLMFKPGCEALLRTIRFMNDFHLYIDYYNGKSFDESEIEKVNYEEEVRGWDFHAVSMGVFVMNGERYSIIVGMGKFDKMTVGDMLSWGHITEPSNEIFVYKPWVDYGFDENFFKIFPLKTMVEASSDILDRLSYHPMLRQCYGDAIDFITTFEIDSKLSGINVISDKNASKVIEDVKRSREAESLVKALLTGA